MLRTLIPAVFLGAVAVIQTQISPLTPDIPPKFNVPTASFDYVKRDVMIPMRDGVKLHTVIVVPKATRNAPIILTRTPYNASKRTERNESSQMLALLPEGDEVFVSDGYIRVFQDVRGKYGSEGEYVMTRPLRGPLNASTVDHSTDAYDTIEWLVNNVPESTRQSHGRATLEGSHDVDPGIVGSGRHVGGHSLLSRQRAERHRQYEEFPGHGPLASQRRQL